MWIFSGKFKHSFKRFWAMRGVTSASLSVNLFFVYSVKRPSLGYTCHAKIWARVEMHFFVQKLHKHECTTWFWIDNSVARCVPPNRKTWQQHLDNSKGCVSILGTIFRRPTSEMLMCIVSHNSGRNPIILYVASGSTNQHYSFIYW